MARGVCLCVLALCICAGCQWNEDEKGEPALPGRGAERATSQEKPEPAKPRVDEEKRLAAQWPPPKHEADEAAKKAEDEKERDYAQELQTAMGSPLGCLKPRPSDNAPPEIVIHIGAHVMPSGGVGRAEVSSPQLDADEVKCIRQIAEARRLAPPIEDAPRRVDTTIRLEPKPSAAAAPAAH